MKTIKKALLFLIAFFLISIFLLIFPRNPVSAASSCSGSYLPSKPVFNPGESITLQAINTTKDYEYEFTIAKSGTSKTICKENKVAKQNGDILNLACTFPTGSDVGGTYFLTIFENSCFYFPPGSGICAWRVRNATCLTTNITVADVVSKERCPSATPIYTTKDDPVVLNFSGGQSGSYQIIVDPRRDTQRIYSLNYPGSTSLNIGTFPNQPYFHSFEIQTETTSGWKTCGGGNFTVSEKPSVQTTKIAYCDPPVNTKIKTALGCIPIQNTTQFVAWLLRFAIGIGGGIAFLLMLFGVFQIITSAGDPERLKAGKETITSALIGLLMIIFSIFLLQLIGVQILQIPGFAKPPAGEP